MFSFLKKKKDEAIINWCEETLEALNQVED